MAGDSRGTDLNSWCRNRATKRQETSKIVAQLRDAQTKLAKVAGNAPVDGYYFENETADDLVAQANNVLTALQTTEKQIPQFVSAQSAEKAKLLALEAALLRASEQRARTMAEMAAQNALKARQHWQHRRQNLRKLCAVVIFVVILIVVVTF